MYSYVYIHNMYIWCGTRLGVGLNPEPTWGRRPAPCSPDSPSLEPRIPFKGSFKGDVGPYRAFQGSFKGDIRPYKIDIGL